MGFFKNIVWDIQHKPYVTKEGYLQKYRPDSPYARTGGYRDGYAPVHRINAGKKEGRVLSSNEHVHHEDGNKLNNRAKNLTAMSPQEHASRHRKGDK